MEGKTYGYVRVSTRDQNEARQLAAMRKFGVAEENIVTEKLSGKDFNRPLYQTLVEKLLPDDVLVVKSIDRLGRNYEEILEQWSYITKGRGAAIVVLDMPLLDTRRGKDLMGAFLSDIVLQVLSFVAENERTNIRQRQAEGIAAAKERGVKFGRREKERPENFDDTAQLWLDGYISAREGARRVGMNHCTFIKYAKHKTEKR